ncbi:MAG: hypothetical protein ACR2NT_12645 [Acidimicrobiia bacterium]
MRNVVIHEYERPDLERLAAAIPGALADYREYVVQVARFVWLPPVPIDPIRG